MQVRTVATTLRTLPRAAYALGATLGALSILSWLVVANANMPMAGMLDVSALLLFTAIWGVGMVAMMFPSLIPMVYTVAVSARKSPETETLSIPHKTSVSTSSGLFILAYVATWTIVGDWSCVRIPSRRAGLSGDVPSCVVACAWVRRSPRLPSSDRPRPFFIPQAWK